MTVLEELDPNQVFSEIQITSPLNNETIKHTSFKSSLKRINEIVARLKEANSHKNITIHFGTKNKGTNSFMLSHYEKEQRLAQLEIEEEKKYFQDLKQADNEDDLILSEEIHKKSLENIDRLRQRVLHTDFVPWIHIEALKKSPFYGNISQEFKSKYVGIFNAKLGYRSPFLSLDTLQFYFQSPINNLRRKYYQIGLQWMNPIRNWGTFHTRLNASNDATFKGIDVKSRSASIGLTHSDYKLQFQRSYREPFIFQNIVRECQKDHHLPSRKYSIKLNKKMENTIQFNTITEGVYAQIKTEASLPFVGDAKFLKLQYDFRRFHDLFFMRNYLSNKFFKKLFWKSTLETNFCASTILNYGPHQYISDFLDNMDIRGFEPHRKPVSSYANVKTSVKYNIHNYPLFGDLRIVPFLFAQTGMALHKQNNKVAPFFIGSTGLGLAYYFTPFLQVELLYSMFQIQSQKKRETVNFQIRIGVFD